ncbi:MAG: hypothetical protein ACI8Y4_004051 [Candidatus Poriferisodalaceae bacterium]|jgi:hypothetical protein
MKSVAPAVSQGAMAQRKPAEWCGLKRRRCGVLLRCYRMGLGQWGMLGWWLINLLGW